MPTCCINGERAERAAARDGARALVSPPPSSSTSRRRRADRGAVGRAPDEADARPKCAAWPGFSNSASWYLSPRKAPPRLANTSWSPSLSRSAKATPWPFCRWPVPVDCGDVHEALAARGCGTCGWASAWRTRARRCRGRSRGSRRCRCRRSSRPWSGSRARARALPSRPRSCRRPGCGRRAASRPCCGRPRYSRGCPRRSARRSRRAGRASRRCRSRRTRW